MLWFWILVGIVVVLTIIFVICAIITGKSMEAYYTGLDDEERYLNDIPEKQEEKIKEEE
jgi:hypothetical protein